MLDGKRAFDLACCVLISPVALPVGLVVASGVRLSSPGPVLHRGTRAGREGVPFTILKFRTMRVSQDGARVTSADDARVTALGRWLRRTKLDELPQVINVLRGDMSIVGPRPEDPVYVAHFPDEYARILSVRPGITGPAALRYRDEERLLQAAGSDDVEHLYLTEFLPAKIALDLDYVSHHTVASDVSIIAATVRALLRGRRPRTGGPTHDRLPGSAD